MICDTLANIGTYTGISKRLAKGLNLLRETDFSTMEAGKYEVDGKDLFYMIQSYQSKEKNDTPEAHRKYIDIQYVLSGEEIYRLRASFLDDGGSQCEPGRGYLVLSRSCHAGAFACRAVRGALPAGCACPGNCTGRTRAGAEGGCKGPDLSRLQGDRLFRSAPSFFGEVPQKRVDGTGNFL